MLINIGSQEATYIFLTFVHPRVISSAANCDQLGYLVMLYSMLLYRILANLRDEVICVPKEEILPILDYHNNFLIIFNVDELILTLQ